MNRTILILSAIFLFCGMVIISGCDKSESLPEKSTEDVKPAPLTEKMPVSKKETADEAELPEVFSTPDIPDRTGSRGGIIEMKNEAAVSEHRMEIVIFTHEKHSLDKPDGHGINCGECHHDKTGNPLLELTANDSVSGCFECHDKKDRPRKPQDISDEDWRVMRLEYYVEAMHDNCIECHKQGGGPVKCTECHFDQKGEK